MPMQKSKSSVDFNKALKTHAQDETDYGREFVNLPAGISGGIAKLVDCRLGTIKTGKNSGEKFFYAAGVVVSPKTALETIKGLDDRGKVRVLSSKEVNVEGQRTSIMIPLCSTQNSSGEVTSAEERIADMLNELRKLGGESCTAEIDSEEALESVMAALKEQGPYFRFSTSSKDPTPEYPQPRVWENWYGGKGLEDYSPEESSGVIDKTPSANGTGESNSGVPNEELDLDDLAQKADDNEDREAMKILREKATEAGVENDAVNDADSWKDVVEMINAQSSGQPAEESPEPADPEKGQPFYVKLVDPKTKKLSKKGVEVEVVSVDKKAKTVIVKRLDNRALVKNIKWDQLSDNE